MRLRHGTLVLAVLLVSTAATSAPRSGPVATPSASSLAADVAALAGPHLEGRGSATPGGERAAQLIRDRLAAAGLLPGGDAGTFMQGFVVSTGVRLAAGNALERSAPGPASFVAGQDFTPHGGSLETDVTGPIVFAGYGLVAPDVGSDDYAGIDVSGKIVMILDGAPPHVKGPPSPRPVKLVAARQRGARAAILIANTLPSVESTSTGVALVSVTATPAVADALLAPAGTTVARLARTIAETRAPVSRAAGSQARIRVAFARVEHRAANVIGILPGTDPALAGEAVVVGAHYDHLGVVDGVVHPGADDNASGSAVVIGLARAFAAAGGTPRTLVFALFTGEEMGLLGSRHYVQQPAVPLARTVAMVNLDMVGRMRDDRLTVGGVDSGSELRRVVTEAARGERVDLTLSGSPFSPSDHTSFYGAGVPVLFFHTGQHDDYHKGTDTVDRINADGMARVTAVTARVVERLAGGGPRPVYASVARPASRPRGPSGTAFLGVAADPRGRDGVRLSRMIPDSAAARAGVREGDVILNVAGVPVASLDELRGVLGRRRPGDRVEVVYLRDGVERATSTTLDATP